LEHDSYLSFDLNMFRTCHSGGLENESFLSFDLNMFPTCHSGGLEDESFLSFDLNMFPYCRVAWKTIPTCLLGQTGTGFLVSSVQSCLQRSAS
jgi:hypothetical protein